MTYTSDIFGICNYIGCKCSTFAGHSVSAGCANVRVHMELMKMIQYMDREPVVRSCNFEATMNNGSSKNVLLTVYRLKESIYEADSMKVEFASAF